MFPFPFKSITFIGNSDLNIIFFFPPLHGLMTATWNQSLTQVRHLLSEPSSSSGASQIQRIEIRRGDFRAFLVDYDNGGMVTREQGDSPMLQLLARPGYQ
jgi:hypothetical protein